MLHDFGDLTQSHTSTLQTRLPMLHVRNSRMDHPRKEQKRQHHQQDDGRESNTTPRRKRERSSTGPKEGRQEAPQRRLWKAALPKMGIMREGNSTSQEEEGAAPLYWPKQQHQKQEETKWQNPKEVSGRKQHHLKERRRGQHHTEARWESSSTKAAPPTRRVKHHFTFPHWIQVNFTFILLRCNLFLIFLNWT